MEKQILKIDIPIELSKLEKLIGKTHLIFEADDYGMNVSYEDVDQNKTLVLYDSWQILGLELKAKTEHNFKEVAENIIHSIIELGSKS